MIVRKLEALFTINTNAIQFKRAASELDNLARKAETVMKAIAGYWAAQALQNFVVNTANAMTEIGKTSEYLGIASDALQELRYAAEKSGVSIDAINDALKELQVRAVDAKSGEGEAAEAFQALGLKSTDAAGKIREPLELLHAVADRLKAMPTQSDRIWISDAIFGDEGSMVLKMLKEGSLGLRKLREEARAMGRVLKNESIVQAEQLNRALHRLKSNSMGIAQDISVNSFDTLSAMANGLSNLMEKINRFQVSKTSSQMVNTGFMGALAFAATKATQVIMKNWVKIRGILLFGGRTALRGSLWGMALLLLQDLWSFFNGADSVTGALASAFDKAFGIMTQGVFQFARTAWPAMVNSFKQAFCSMEKEFLRFSDWLSAGIVKLVKKTSDFFSDLVPGFLKSGISPKVKMSHDGEFYTPKMNHHLGPAPASFLNNPRVSNHQNVNVAVNVATQANPHEIGGAVSKAIKQALERERFNAFMGVMNYAS